MSVFDIASHQDALSPGELDMLVQTLDVWCGDRKIDRKNAKDEATILLNTFRGGKKSQIDLLDALNASR